jgi:hypothetical protein
VRFGSLSILSKSAFRSICFGLSVVKIAMICSGVVSSSCVYASNGDEHVSIILVTVLCMSYHRGRLYH